VVVPLGWKGFLLDFESYMSSVEHLQATFDLQDGSLTLDGQRWPAGVGPEGAFVDAAWSQFEWEYLRSSFTYVVLTRAGDRQLGAGYISWSNKVGYRVECQTWVRADEAAKGFDEELYLWFRDWVEKYWPFNPRDIGWPGRVISWDDWNALPDILRTDPVDTAIRMD
jgi:hypothetical protein